MKSFFKNIYAWINERFPLEKFINWCLHEEIPGGPRFSYTLGSAALFLLMVQILTGVWQLFYYVPTIDHAYQSLTYFRREVPFGWLIHGLHYWGATAFTVVVGLHMMRVFIWGAYKKPREMVWLVGVSLLVLTALFMLTGPILPWDKEGYWAAKVSFSIAGSAPVVGSLAQAFLQGAAQVGQITLSRIFLLHVALLPAVIMVLVTIHLIAFRQFGSTGPWKKEEREKKGPFWPDQAFKDMLVAFSVLVLLIALTVLVPAAYSGPADPRDTTYAPKPEWNLLFIYQSLKPFKGEWERVGTMGIPLTILLLLLSLPFIDRSDERDPFKRVFVLSCGALLVGFISFMTYTGLVFNANGDIQGKNSFSQQASLPHEVMTDVEQKQRVAQGRYLFYKDCSECHTLNGRPNGLQGPDLLMVLNHQTLSRDWLKVQVTAPQRHFAHTTMPAFNYLSGKNIDSLVDFLHSLSAHNAIATTPVPTSSPGEALFKTIGCAGCHTVTGQSIDTQGPDLLQALSVRQPDRAWLQRQIQSPDTHFSNSSMPAYGYLHQDQVNALVDYLKTLESKAYPSPSIVGGLDQKIPLQPLQGLENDTGPATETVGESEHGKVLYQQYCMVCHNPANENVPSLKPIRRGLYQGHADDFVRHIDPIIQDGGHGGMPAFNKTLSQSQIADIEAYILHLNGVDRSQIINPGIKPETFLRILAAIVLAMAIGAGLLWYRTRP